MKNIKNPILNVDFYKTSHKKMYPSDMTRMYSNLTPRSAKHFTFKSSMFDNKVVVFGLQTLVIKLNDEWEENFFSQPIEPLVQQYKSVMLQCLGINNPDVSYWYELHAVGYLPITIKGLKEGTRSPMGVPIFTITNTHDDFAWLVNYLETYLSTNIWKAVTMATNTYEYKRVLNKFNIMTADTTNFIPWQVHDFSARGLGNSEEWSTNSIAHLTAFSGTDTVQAILGAKHYYDADLSCGGSIPATEHSVMTLGISQSTASNKLEAEKEYLHKLLTELYPTGPLAVVSDSYDFWGVIEHNLPALKDVITSRDGKLVIRPDSGTPIDVICGQMILQDSAITLESSPEGYDTWTQWVAEDIHDTFVNELDAENPMYDIVEHYRFGEIVYEVTYEPDLNRHDKTYYYVDNYGSTLSKCKFKQLPLEVKNTQQKGLLQSIWDIFGGTINNKGYKVLDPHIGIIYGDAITPDKYEAILTRMESMGFSSDNLVVGAGAYPAQMITRDTFGFAIKATAAIIKGKVQQVFKQPKTDPGKNSAKGYMRVDIIDGEYVVTDGLDSDEGGELKVIFRGGNYYNKITLEDVRGTLN